MKVILMRGIPGSGKSTLISKHFETYRVLKVETEHSLKDCQDAILGCGRALVICADDFVGEGFSTRIPEGHKACMRAFVALMQAHIETTVIVDNTNTTAAELSSYVAVFNAFAREGIDTIEIWQADASLPTCMERQVHGVPAKVMLAMRARLTTEVLPPWFPNIELFFTE